MSAAGAIAGISGQLYEAKVLRVDAVQQPTLYFIHYQGWNKKHDEWVDSARMLKWTEANLATQKAMQSTTAAQAPVKTKKEMTKASASPAVASGKQTPKQPAAAAAAPAQRVTGRKRRGDETGDSGIDIEEAAKRPDIKLDIPLILRQQLLDESDRIVKERKVLDAFSKAYTRPLGSPDYSPEILDGLRTYFNEALGTLLLYRFERLQYAQMRDQNPDVQPAELYGPEHLLRLFVKLPSLISITNMDDESIQGVLALADSLLQFLAAKAATFFLGDYENATADYIKQSKE